MKSTPLATTWRSSAIAPLRSGGSPHIPRPVMRIAPKPIRATVRSPPIVIVPAWSRRVVAGVIARLLALFHRRQAPAADEHAGGLALHDVERIGLHQLGPLVVDRLREGRRLGIAIPQ